MTRFAAASIVGLFAGVVTTTTATMQVPPRAAIEQLAKARTAMGGTAALAAVKSLMLKTHDRDRYGTMYPDRTGSRPPQYGESNAEIRAILPDQFLLVSEAHGPGPGLAGLVQRSTQKLSPGTNTGRVDDWAHEAFGYLMLALLLRNDTVFPFALRGVNGDALHFVDPNGVDVFVDLDPRTSLPQRLRYDFLQRGVGGVLTGERHPTRLELASYSAVAQLRLPRTWRIYRGEQLMQERRFETIEINPTLTSADFK